VELIAIVYPDPFTGSLAMDDLSAAVDVVVRQDEMAVIVRDDAGGFRVATNAVITVDAPSWSMLWAALFASLFFVPLAGMRIGADLAPLIEAIDRSGLDSEFVRRVRALMAPGTSALFVLAEAGLTDAVVDALDEYGGTVLQCVIGSDAEEMLTSALGGRQDRT